MPYIEFFFFNDTATTEIYTLSLHDALPISTKPLTFGRLTFTEKDINPFATEAEQAKIRELLKNSRNEGLYTPPSLRGTISFPGHNGGANWGSVAVNPEKGFLYVITKEHPTLD